MKENKYIERSVNQGSWICWVALGHKTGAWAKAVALLGKWLDPSVTGGGKKRWPFLLDGRSSRFYDGS